MLKFTSDKTERLDKFLAQVVEKSRGAVQKAIKAGVVTVNTKPVSETDHKVFSGDIIELPEFTEFVFQPSTRDLKIVYEDNDLAVIDKPAGLIVHPGAGKTEDTLSHALLTKFPQIKNVGEKFRPGIVHRLDEDTSGLLLIAKTPDAYEYLKKLFMERKVQKEYLALVHGVPQMLHDFIDAPLIKSFKQRKMRVGPGREAVTEYTVLTESAEGVDQMALLKVNLHTGRTHQIRVHMAHIKHPIVGDQIYGGEFKKTDLALINRQFLHAYRLRFKKLDGTSLDLTSPLPAELQSVLSRVGIKYAE